MLELTLHCFKNDAIDSLMLIYFLKSNMAEQLELNKVEYVHESRSYYQHRQMDKIIIEEINQLSQKMRHSS